jgi:hypothetical protein
MTYSSKANFNMKTWQLCKFFISIQLSFKLFYLNMLAFRIIAILLRIYLHTSPIGKKMASLFLFTNINSSIESIKESNFIYTMLPSGFNSDTHIIVIQNLKKTNFTSFLFSFVLEDRINNIIIFSIFDVGLAMLMSNFTSNGKNKYIEIIYLFNPITALSCSKLNLSTFYNLVNFIFYIKNGHILFYPLYLLTVVLTPEYYFLNTFFMLYNTFEQQGLKKRLPSILIIIIGGCLVTCTNLWFNYLNYYSLKDNLPNLNIHWALITSVNKTLI